MSNNWLHEASLQSRVHMDADMDKPDAQMPLNPVFSTIRAERPLCASTAQMRYYNMLYILRYSNLGEWSKLRKAPVRVSTILFFVFFCETHKKFLGLTCENSDVANIVNA